MYFRKTEEPVPGKGKQAPADNIESDAIKSLLVMGIGNGTCSGNRYATLQHLAISISDYQVWHTSAI